MAVRFLPISLLLLLVFAVSASAASLGGTGGDHLQLGILSTGGECRGTVAECLVGGEDENEEEAVGSASGDAQRRVLAGRGRGRGYPYISYGALRRDTVPCSRRGASYYNCRPGGSANPYQRGCSRITRCRG